MSNPNNYERTAGWLSACGKQPNPEGLSVQIGCDMEEIAEYLETLTISSPTGAMANVLLEATSLLNMIAGHLKRGEINASISDKVGCLDALCDREVTANGVAYMAGFLKTEADQRVLDSNDDKLNPDGTPVILPGGKIGKRAGWAAPVLDDLVPSDPEQSPV